MHYIPFKVTILQVMKVKYWILYYNSKKHLGSLEGRYVTFVETIALAKVVMGLGYIFPFCVYQYHTCVHSDINTYC